MVALAICRTLGRISLEITLNEGVISPFSQLDGLFQPKESKRNIQERRILNRVLCLQQWHFYLSPTFGIAVVWNTWDATVFFCLPVQSKVDHDVNGRNT